ncbi:hypothetical protein PMAYCL1PPCAC_32200, partial [Pristionchus mayeri]
ELIPAQAAEFLTGLSEEDKKILKEIGANYASYKDEDEALAALKEKSSDLYEKAEKLRGMLKEKVDQLGAEAKAFLEELLADARKVQVAVVAGNKPTLEELKQKVIAAYEKFVALSDEAKADLEKVFPITAGVFKNEKVQALAKGFLNKE